MLGLTTKKDIAFPDGESSDLFFRGDVQGMGLS